jgi:hypothetical protein
MLPLFDALPCQAARRLSSVSTFSVIRLIEAGPLGRFTRRGRLSAAFFPDKKGRQGSRPHRAAGTVVMFRAG